MIFSLSDTIIGEQFGFGISNNVKTKIQLSYTNKKGKNTYHNLIVPRNRCYNDVPKEHYLYIEDEGIYFFWIFVKDKFYPLYIGSGNLSTRIRQGYQKYNSALYHSIKNLYVSFDKKTDLCKKDIKNLETKYIKKLCPILNKTHANVANKTYIENLNAYAQLIKEGDADEVWV